VGKNRLADIPGNFFVAQLGTHAALASNGANAVLPATGFVAPADIKILSAWRHVNGAAEATVGTATSSASYRRFTILNGGIDGLGTTIIASVNNTASAAQWSTRAFTTTANNTVTQGNIIVASQLTVGAATADGTDAAQGVINIAYELL
jgi:hypothetical protein